MSDYLLEILSEEIPALMQKTAAENLLKIATEVFQKNNLSFDSTQIRTFVTPRRLTLYVYSLKDKQIAPSTKKVGPKIGADQKAIDGFLKSNGVANIEDLQKVDGAYVFIKPEVEIKTAQIIQNSLLPILNKMTVAWPKLMRWDVENESAQPKWIRPIRNIASVFGDEIIELNFAGLKANKKTFGKNNDALELENAANYQEILKKNFVILDHVQRKQLLLDQIKKIKLDYGLELIDDEKSTLFEEVVGLCEWPTALVASIEQRFLELPDEVLILTLKSNQKYFCLKTLEGNLAPEFIFVTNAILNEDNRQKIIQDNEKLVRARLSDAEFFIHEDLKRPLISRLPDLEKIVFHQKLGSIRDKIYRLNSLSKFLSIFVPHCSLPLAERSADLCKVDLTTKAVAELPELQGKIGSFYALKQGEDKKVVAAIYEHYLPLGPNSELPKTALGIVLSIADKMDSIVGFFLAGEKPTSSKDPFALRRAVLGIVRIGFSHNIAFPIRILIEKSLNSYPAKLQKTLLENDKKSFYESRKYLVEEIIKFFVERLKVHLKENDQVRAEVVNVVIDEYLSDLDAHKYIDILYLAKKVKFLNQFVTDSQHKNLIELYKRTANILAIEEKKDGEKFEGKISVLALKTKYEKVLYRRTKQISADFYKLIVKGEFVAAFKLLEVLEGPLSHFFDHIVVNDKNKDMRRNRLNLLSQIRALFNEIGDLSKIEIS